jgi:NADPH2:quinone reductase
MAWNGRYLVIGFAGGPIPSIPTNLPLLKGCSIVGVFWGAFLAREPKMARENHNMIVDLLVTGTLKPHISKIYKLAEAGLALDDIAQRRTTGKVVLVTQAFEKFQTISKV